MQCEMNWNKHTTGVKHKKCVASLGRPGYMMNVNKPQSVSLNLDRYSLEKFWKFFYFDSWIWPNTPSEAAEALGAEKQSQNYIYPLSCQIKGTVPTSQYRRSKPPNSTLPIPTNLPIPPLRALPNCSSTYPQESWDLLCPQLTSTVRRLTDTALVMVGLWLETPLLLVGPYFILKRSIISFYKVVLRAAEINVKLFTSVEDLRFWI